MNRLIAFFKKIRSRFVEFPKFKKEFLCFINECNEKKDVTLKYCEMIVLLGKIQNCLPRQDYTSYLLTMHNIYQNKEELKKVEEKDLIFARQELAGMLE